MAVLQKIRNRGILLVSIIAIALFLFVMGDLLRGGEGLINQSRQNVGEIDGTSVSIQDYQSVFEDFQVYNEIAQQRTSTSEEENNQLKDMAWNTMIQNKLIEKECNALGIGVTDDEVAEVIRSGQNQLLQVPAFANQQTGRYDYAQLTTFLNEYKRLKDAGEQIPEVYEKLYKYYMFVQKQVRSQLLANKYQTLASKCVMSNPVEAKQTFEDRANESDVLLVSIPFTSVADDKVTVSDADIEAKYKAEKEKYKQYVESRDVKLIDVQVVASDADRKALAIEMDSACAQLAAATTNAQAGNVARQNTSLLSYSDVMKTKDAFPQMIKNRLDGDSTSLAVGQTSKPVYDAATNSFYTMKLLDKKVVADSVLFRQMAVIGKDEQDIAKKSDSIMNAISSGAKFKDIAKKYNQVGDSAWITTAQFQNSALDADNTNFINTLYNMTTGQTKALKFTNGNTVILQVLESRNPVTKYNVAAVVRELKFSDDTYSSEYNKFSSFLAANSTIEQLEANATKEGYTVRPLTDITTSNHNVAGIHNTRDAIKWLFDEAKVNSISQLYECGDNDHLLVVALTGINPEGYASVDKVKDMLRTQLLNEKKAEKILADAANVKDIAAAKKIAGAVVDSVNHVSFGAPAFIRSVGSSEPIVSALASKTAQGKFAGPVKGNGGVYMLQVLKKNKTVEKYDEKAEQSQLANSNFRYISQSILNSLFLKANVKDARYKFF